MKAHLKRSLLVLLRAYRVAASRSKTVSGSFILLVLICTRVFFDALLSLWLILSSPSLYFLIFATVITMSNSPAFFYLDPLDQAAAQIVSLPVNLRFKHILVEGRACLRVGVDHVPKRPGQLISFGRNPSLCDIALPQDFPGTQCHFSINPQSGELLLRDDTEDMSTLLSAPSTPEDQRLRLPDSRPRQRVVLTTEKGNLIRMKNAQFLLLWSERATRERALEEAKNKAMIGPGVALNLGSDLGLERGQIIHSRIAELGKGVTATVFKTLNLNTGDHLAVKSFHFESPKHQDAVKVVVRKEVVLLSQLSHVRSDLVEDFLNIAVFLHAQGWEPTKRIEIFMVAYPRSLHDRLLQYRSSTGWCNSSLPCLY